MTTVTRLLDRLAVALLASLYVAAVAADSIRRRLHALPRARTTRETS